MMSAQKRFRAAYRVARLARAGAAGDADWDALGAEGVSPRVLTDAMRCVLARRVAFTNGLIWAREWLEQAGLGHVRLVHAVRAALVMRGHALRQEWLDDNRY